MNDRELIREAFKILRRHGVRARMNLMCCQSCAWAKLEEDGATESDDILFYHAQDAEAFGRDGNIKPGDVLYLAHQGAAAKMAAILFEALGFEVEWDGTAAKRLGLKGVIN